MAYTAHFHGGPRDGTSRQLEVEDRPALIFPDVNEADQDEMNLALTAGQPAPASRNGRYSLREEPIDNDVDYDWRDDQRAFVTGPP
jgi:hypothetical protein